jgi:serine/threonine-protein kinase
MSLTQGTRFGSYEIVSPLGAGGMGQVYRARDTRLNRDVALKVLPDLFASDPERLARFTREAQTLAALNHPNIAHIHGLEEEGAAQRVRALVMELVEGEDLSTLIARWPLPVPEAIAIARQIADALEAAHEQGIIHRDLKPANIKVRADGTVKVLDFGLAKALAPDGANATVDHLNSPTLSVHATQMGIILGTAAYMAPEQARGKAVDRRADIWAFGVVLYEMLTGRRAFDGDEVSDVLATVLKTDPEWQALPTDTPVSVRRLLRRCLEKDPRKRLRAIGDARLDLDDTEPAIVSAGAGVPRRGVSFGTAAALVVVTLISTALAMYLLSRSTTRPGPDGLTRAGITLPDGDEVIDTNLQPMAISRDGTRIAYIGGRDGSQRLYVRRLSDDEPTQIAGTDGARTPFFSPDGNWIGFFTPGWMNKVAVGSTVPERVTETTSEQARGAVWSPDDTIYFAPNNVSSIWRVPAAGGKASEVTHLDSAKGEISHRWPEVVTDGKTLLFSSWTGPGSDERTIVALTLATGEQRVVASGADAPRSLSSGYLAYTRQGSLLAVPWNPSQDQPAAGTAVPLPELVSRSNEGGANFAASSSGTLAYLTSSAAGREQRIVWVDRAGATEALPVQERAYDGIAISPDGGRAVVQIREGVIGLWIYDFARRTMTPLVTTAGSSQAPVWTPDGSRVVYRGTCRGSRNLYWKAVDGSGEEQRVTTKPGVVQTPAGVSQDGRWLVFSEGNTLWRTPLTGDTSAGPQQLMTNAVNGQLSPDGRWVAYQSTLGGRLEVYVAAFPDPGPRIPISADGGSMPLWSRDGRELFYCQGDRLMAVSLTPGATLTVGPPRLLHEGPYRLQPGFFTAFSVSRSGRFLRVQPAQPPEPIKRVNLVLNWFSELTNPAAK